jgi:hypothetical protein
MNSTFNSPDTQKSPTLALVVIDDGIMFTPPSQKIKSVGKKQQFMVKSEVMVAMYEEDRNTVGFDGAQIIKRQQVICSSFS